MKKGLYVLLAFMVLAVTLTFWGNEVYAKDYQIKKAEFDVEFLEDANVKLTGFIRRLRKQLLLRQPIMSKI